MQPEAQQLNFIPKTPFARGVSNEVPTTLGRSRRSMRERTAKRLEFV